MADIVTGTVTGQLDTSVLHRDHSDIRQEIATESCGINKNVAFQGQEGLIATKDATYDVATRIESANDRTNDLTTQYFISSLQTATESARDIASLKVLTDSNASRVASEIAAAVAQNAAATALESQKIATAIALGQGLLSKDILADGQKTRDLLHDMKYHDLNRSLLERNAELVECNSERRDWRYRADQSQNQGQWAQLQSQLQAFQSQLQETRQGMVNFGSMNGVGQTSTSNNVR